MDYIHFFLLRTRGNLTHDKLRRDWRLLFSRLPAANLHSTHAFDHHLCRAIAGPKGKNMCSSHSPKRSDKKVANHKKPQPRHKNRDREPKRDKNRDKSYHGFHSYTLVSPRFQSRSRSQMPSITLFPDMDGISHNAGVNKSRGGRRSRFLSRSRWRPNSLNHGNRHREPKPRTIPRQKVTRFHVAVSLFAVAVASQHRVPQYGSSSGRFRSTSEIFVPKF